MGLLNLRNALMAGKRLPYDTEVEYLESTGTQWIDTGYSFNSATDSVELTFELLSSTPVYKWIFGAYDTKRLAIGSGDGANGRRLAYNETATYENDSFYFGGPHVYFANSTGTGIDGQKKINFASFSTSSNILLYTIPLDTTAYCSNSRIWSYKHYRNGVLVRDFIPVRKGTVGYLYDRVSQRLFGNAGTGDFVLGQDVVPVEWIGTTGSQHIDTGIRATQDSVIRCTLTPISRTYNGMVFYGAGKADGEAGFGDMVELVDQYNNYGHIVFVATGRAANGIEFSYGNTLVTTANCSTGALTVNGTTATTANRLLTGTAQYPLYIGCANVAGTRFRGANCRYHSFAIEQSGILAGSFYPVRVGTEGAMMDVLTRRIYRNAGTGAFTYGNDLKYPIPA